MSEVYLVHEVKTQEILERLGEVKVDEKTINFRDWRIGALFGRTRSRCLDFRFRLTGCKSIYKIKPGTDLHIILMF